MDRLEVSDGDTCTAVALKLSMDGIVQEECQGGKEKTKP